MPEIAIDKYRHAQANEHKVWVAEDARRMNAVAKSKRPELFTDC
jgi:hypothetical protein